MIDLILPVLMWAVVVACAASLRRGRDSSVLIAVVLMAIAFTVDVRALYLAIDPALGARNVADLIKQTFFVGAVAFLARGLRRAAAGRIRKLWWVVPAAVILVQTVAFLRIDMTQGTVIDLMPSYGDQFAAFVYSQAHFLYFGVTLGLAGVACWRSGYQSAPRAVGVGVRFLIAGCVASVLTAILLLARDVLRIAGRTGTSAAFERLYAPMLLLSVLFVAAGLAIPPIAGAALRRRVRREVPSLLRDLAELRDRIAGTPRRRLPVGARVPGGDATALDEVHRLVVEVGDQLFLNPSFVVTPAERAALEAGERLVGRLELR